MPGVWQGGEDVSFFRPHTEPYRTIYDALAVETEKRGKRPVDEWIQAEREAVHRAACDYAQKHGLRAPTMSEVERAERHAEGHCDYMATWAYAVGRYMTPLEASK